MSEQPKALRLADDMSLSYHSRTTKDEIATELRRQASEIARLTELHTLYQDKTTRLKAERDAAVRELELTTVERNRAYRACEQISVRLHAAMAERDALQAQRQPLTGKAIIDAYDNMEFSGKLSAFIEGARYAEQAHGIGGDK